MWNFMCCCAKNRKEGDPLLSSNGLSLTDIEAPPPG